VPGFTVFTVLRIRICIILGSWIRIRIKVKSWIRIRIKVKKQDTDPHQREKQGPDPHPHFGALEGSNIGKSEW
jgi:hypothetical protein